MQQISAALLILVFAYTGISKLLDLQGFNMILSQSNLLRPFASFIAVSIPIMELVLVMLLFIPSHKQYGFIGSFLLFFFFSAYIAIMLFSAEDLPCSCGGIISKMSWPQHLVFNNIFMVMAGLSAWYNHRNKNFIAMDRGSRKPVETSRQTSRN